MDGGDDLLEKYDELDPRFAQTIAAHGANWKYRDWNFLIFCPVELTM